MVECEKYLILSALEQLRQLEEMQSNHIDQLGDDNSEAYKSVSRQVTAGNVDVPDEDVKNQVENIKVNLMNANINLNQIITDLEDTVKGAPVNKDDSVPDDDSESVIEDVEIEEVN